MEFRTEYWRLESLELPIVWRHCASCQDLRAFVCCERFRVNAQKRVLDVWLLYRCRQCENVWKYSVLSRCRVAAIDPALREECEANDPGAVRRYALDVSRLRLQVSRVELSEQVHIVRTLVAAPVAAPGDVIHFEVPWPCALRLDRLLANELQLSRSELQSRVADGRLQLWPAQAAALRNPVQDGQRVCFIGGIGYPSPD